MYEHDVARMIRGGGWKIIRGPYFNANLYAKKGVFVWTIKSVLSAAEMRSRGIKVDAKTGKPGHQRTVRFAGTVENGTLTSIKHLTSSGRKKVGKGRKRGRGGHPPTSPGIPSGRTRT